jgi:hypothetical protein
MNKEFEVLQKQHHEIQNKYRSLLLAVAASAIALSLKRTMNSKITYSMIPLAFAILLWGLSFVFGCRHSLYIESNIYNNLQLLLVQEGKHPEVVGYHPAEIEAAAQGIRDAMECNNKRAMSYGRWQFRLLVIGALFFIGWHITEMIKLTINSTG